MMSVFCFDSSFPELLRSACLWLGLFDDGGPQWHMRRVREGEEEEEERRAVEKEWARTREERF